MTTASLVPSQFIATLPPAAALTNVSTDALGEAIAVLTARLHAATYELLVLLREFDSRTAWRRRSRQRSAGPMPSVCWPRRR